MARHIRRDVSKMTTKTHGELRAKDSVRSVMAVAISGGTPSHVFFAACRASSHACRSSLRQPLQSVGQAVGSLSLQFELATGTQTSGRNRDQLKVLKSVTQTRAASRCVYHTKMPVCAESLLGTPVKTCTGIRQTLPRMSLGEGLMCAGLRTSSRTSCAASCCPSLCRTSCGLPRNLGSLRPAGETTDKLGAQHPDSRVPSKRRYAS